MARFAPNRERWGYMGFKMPWEEMETVLSLIKDRAVDLEFREVPVPGAEGSYNVTVKPKGSRHLHNNPSDRAIFEKYIKPVFMASRSMGQPHIHLRDERLASAYEEAGRQRTGITAFLSWLVAKGILARDGRGLYRLP